MGETSLGDSRWYQTQVNWQSRKNENSWKSCCANYLHTIQGMLLYVEQQSKRMMSDWCCTFIVWVRKIDTTTCHPPSTAVLSTFARCPYSCVLESCNILFCACKYRRQTKSYLFVVLSFLLFFLLVKYLLYRTYHATTLLYRMKIIPIMSPIQIICIVPKKVKRWKHVVNWRIRSPTSDMSRRRNKN